jgi:hypothetical protein
MGLTLAVGWSVWMVRVAGMFCAGRMRAERTRETRGRIRANVFFDMQLDSKKCDGQV